MGIWDIIDSSTKAVIGTSYSYGSAACAKIDNTVRVNGLQRLDDETKSEIGNFAVKFAANAVDYALDEGYKSVPGGVAVSNIVSKTIKEVKHETLNEKPKPLEERDSAPGKKIHWYQKINGPSKDTTRLS